MCSWGAACGETGQCQFAHPTLGCSKPGPNCETCALGFLTTTPPAQKTGVATLHKSVYATLGKLCPNKGWVITRPDKGSGLTKGAIVTALNGIALDGDIESAKQTIIDFYSYMERSVTISLLESDGQTMNLTLDRR